jgi:AcrR family transcriptional regulator
VADAALTAGAASPLALPIVGQPSERGDASRNRQRILAAARAIVAEHGAQGLSMNAVAAAAGVGKGTIFRRFGDREGLLYALLDDDTVALQDGFLSGPPPLGPGAAPAARLKAFVIAFIRFQLAHIELLLATERGHGEARSPVLSAFQLHVASLLAEIDPELDAPVLAALILNSVSAQTIRELDRELGTTPAQLERAALTLLRGVTRRRR